MYAPGKIWLKATGIISVIIGFFMFVYGVYWASNVRDMLANPEWVDVAKTVAIPYAIYTFVLAIMTFAAGMIGVKNADDTEAYKKCMIYGVCVAVLNLVPLFTGADLLELLISMIVPVCYLIGAMLNKYGNDEMRRLD